MLAAKSSKIRLSWNYNFSWFHEAMFFPDVLSWYKIAGVFIMTSHVNLIFLVHVCSQPSLSRSNSVINYSFSWLYGTQSFFLSRSDLLWNYFLYTSSIHSWSDTSNIYKHSKLPVIKFFQSDYLKITLFHNWKQQGLSSSDFSINYNF